jgi:hypothetical protein
VPVDTSPLSTGNSHVVSADRDRTSGLGLPQDEPRSGAGMLTENYAVSPPLNSTLLTLRRLRDLKAAERLGAGVAAVPVSYAAINSAGTRPRVLTV